MPKALLAAAQPPLPPPRGPASARPRAQGFHGKLSLGTTTRSPRYWHSLQNLGRSVGRPALARGPGTPVRGRRGRPASRPAAQPSVTAARRDMSGVLTSRAVSCPPVWLSLGTARSEVAALPVGSASRGGWAPDLSFHVRTSRIPDERRVLDVRVVSRGSDYFVTSAKKKARGEGCSSRKASLRAHWLPRRRLTTRLMCTSPSARGDEGSLGGGTQREGAFSRACRLEASPGRVVGARYTCRTSARARA